MFSQKFHLNHRLSALNSGRSMLEMLAVIALIGVISIGGLWSFMYATAKHDATAIMEDVASRAVRVMTTDANYRDRPADFEWQFAKMKNDTIKTLKSDKPAYIYRVVVLNIDKMVCNSLLTNRPDMVQAIYVNGRLYKNATQAQEFCQKGDNTVSFYYGRYLDVPVPSCENQSITECQVCEDGEIFDIDDGTACSTGICCNGTCGECCADEDCSGAMSCINGTCTLSCPECQEVQNGECVVAYNTKECCENAGKRWDYGHCCDQGSVWSSENNQCVSQSCTTNNDCANKYVYSVCQNGECVCDEGYFRNANLNCTLCSTNDAKATSEEECDKCPSRVYTSSGMCALCSNITALSGLAQEDCEKCNTNSEEPVIFDNGKCYAFNCATTKRRENFPKELCETICDGEYTWTSVDGDADNYCVPKSRSCTADSDCWAYRSVCRDGICGCPAGQILRNGWCSGCNNSSGYVPPEFCGWCDDTSYPWAVVDGVCQRVTCKNDSHCTKEGQVCSNYTCVCDEGYFMDSSGNCRLCSDTSVYTATEAECDKCVERGMYGNKCGLDTEPACEANSDCQYNNNACVDGVCGCSSGWYRASARDCIKCASNSGVDWRNASQEECGKCSFWVMMGNMCTNCEYKGSLDVTEEQCHLCDSTTKPRAMVDGTCQRVECTLDSHCAAGSTCTPEHTCEFCTAEGYFVGSDGKCKSCEATESAKISADECEKCPTHKYAADFGICYNKTCNSNQYINISDSGAGCTNCGTGGGNWISTTAEECANADNICEATYVYAPSIHACYRACDSEGFRRFQNRGFQSYSTCMSCSNNDGQITAVEECAKCNNTDYPRVWDETLSLCILATCPSGRFRASDTGSCKACNDSSTTIPATAEECANCTSTQYPRMIVDGTCQRVECLNDSHCWAGGVCTEEHTCVCGAEGYFEDSDGNCRACSASDSYSATETECNKCYTTANPRFMLNGQCTACNNSVRAETTEAVCNKCNYLTSRRKWYSQFGYCHVDACTTNSQCQGIDDGSGNNKGVCNNGHCRCPTNYFLGNQSGKCRDCSTTVGISADEEDCAMCATTASPRAVVDGMCVLVECAVDSNCSSGKVCQSDHTCGCATGYVKLSGADRCKKICVNDSDCSTGEECVYNMAEVAGVGVCIEDDGIPTEIASAGGKTWIKTTGTAGQMNWATAQDYCVNKGYNPATATSLGCQAVKGLPCSSDIMTSLRAQGWNGDKYWLVETDGSNAFVMYFGNNGGTSLTKKTQSSSRYAICYRNE